MFKWITGLLRIYRFVGPIFSENNVWEFYCIVGLHCTLQCMIEI